MAKKPVLTDLTSLTNSSAINAINENWDAIEEAFNNTLSLDGSTPNAMNADLDLNGNDLLNVGTIDVENLSLNGQQVTDISTVPEWRGAWATATTYFRNDLVRREGSSYICLQDHTSGIFSTDLTNNRWELFAQQGAAGSGTGDMVAANNLSDLTNTLTARTNLGLGTVAVENIVPITKGGTGATDAATARANLGAQAAGATLASLEGLSLVSGDTLYSTAPDTLARLPIGATGQVLTVVSGAPAWSNSNYTWLTPQATTSGSSWTFSSIPSWATEIVILFDIFRVSAGTWGVRLRTSGADVSTGYLSTSSTVDGTHATTNVSTVFMNVFPSSVLSGFIGTMTLRKWPTSNLWISEHSGYRAVDSDATVYGGGRVILAGVLDGVSLVVSGGSGNQGNVVVGYR